MSQNTISARPRIWTCFVYPLLAIILAVVLQGIFGAVLALSMVAGGTPPEEMTEKILSRIADPDMFLLTLLLGQSAFAILIIVPAFLSKQSIVQRLGLREVQRPVLVYGLTMTGSIFVLAIAILAAYLVTLVITPDGSVAAMYERMTPGWGIAFVFLIALLPGVIEECLFRGYIQQRFLTRWNPILSIFVTSVLFALVHLAPPAVALAFIIGVWLGFIGWKTHSILPCIACHAFINGGLNAWRLIIKFAEIDESTANVVNGVLVVIGLIGFFLAIRMLIGMQPPSQERSTTMDETVPANAEMPLVSDQV